MTEKITRSGVAWAIVVLIGLIGRADDATPRQMRDMPFPQEVCRQWTQEHGLPAAAVERIWIEWGGKVRVITPEGPAVLDGQRFRPPDVVSPLPARASLAEELPSPVPWEPVNVVKRDAEDRLWIGTAGGAARWTGRRWRCYHSRRWLPDDRVNDLDFGPDGSVWIATAGGVTRLSTQKMTLEEKARQFHDVLRKRHVWRGLVRASRLERPGQVDTFHLPSDDNDGLWTALYVAAESFRYAATGDDEAKQNATESIDALLFLEEVTGLPGFIARSYTPAGEGPQHGGEWHPSGDGRWDWKGDTSSDELDGHMFAWAIYYDLVADEPYRRRIAEVAGRTMDRIIEHGFYWVGPTGKPTTWGVWAPERMNHDPKWTAERGLNSLEILSHLKVVHHVTGDEKYQREYEALVRDHAYATNTVRQKIVFPPWAVNHSDDELAFLAYYPLLRYEEDPRLREYYLLSIERSWQIERPERSALFNFIYASAVGGPDPPPKTVAMLRDLFPRSSGPEGTFDLAVTVAALRDVPLDLISWRVVNSTRRDVPRAPYANRSGRPLAARVLPASERPLMRWNGDPYHLDGGSNGLREDDGTFFLLPYWMARYHRFLLP